MGLCSCLKLLKFIHIYLFFLLFMWELCNGWHSKNRGLTECIISRCGIAFSDSPPLIDWAQHSPFITRAEAWSRRSAIINSLLSFIQNSRVGQIRMLFLQLYRGQNIHKVSIQLDLGWLAQPNSKGLHDKISMNNCCFEKKKIFSLTKFIFVFLMSLLIQLQ